MQRDPPHPGLWALDLLGCRKARSGWEAGKEEALRGEKRRGVEKAI